MPITKVPVILRSFKAGWGKRGVKIADDELSLYKKHLREDVNRFLEMKSVGAIYVVTNGDSRSELSEKLHNGHTPTTRFIRDEFPDANRVKTLICCDWGMNVGSASALNVALEAILRTSKPKYILIVSTTVDLSEDAVHRALNASETFHLQVCGFLRQNHWERYQWRLVQNTAALWRTSVFRKHGLFSERCNGDGRTVMARGQEALLAGMEDYHFMLRLFKADPEDFRWGMVMRRNPVYWSVAHYNADEMSRHMIKILRQEAVIRAYAREEFPNQSFQRLMDNFFACGQELP